VCFLLGTLAFILLKMTLRTLDDITDDENKEEKMESRADRLSSATIGLLWVSVGIALTVAYASTVTLSGLAFVTGSRFSTATRVVRGTTLEALQWAIFGLSVLFALGVRHMIRSNDSSDDEGQHQKPATKALSGSSTAQGVSRLRPTLQSGARSAPPPPKAPILGLPAKR
jgi:hypothetical protein